MNVTASNILLCTAVLCISLKIIRNELSGYAMLSNQNNRIFIAKTFPWSVVNMKERRIKIKTSLFWNLNATTFDDELCETQHTDNSCAKISKISYNLKHLTSDISGCSSTSQLKKKKKDILMENKSFSRREFVIRCVADGCGLTHTARPEFARTMMPFM